MSSNIVLPTLTQFTKNFVTALVQAKNHADIQSSVDNFLSKNATITVNGTKLTHAAFVKQISQENIEEQSATVDFTASVQEPTTGFDAGSVGLFYTATIAEKIRIHDGPVTSKVTASLNVVIAEDPSIPKPHPTVPIHGFFDGRRIMALNEVRTQAPVDGRITTQ